MMLNPPPIPGGRLRSLHELVEYLRGVAPRVRWRTGILG
jgi:hypothetical protein